MLALDRAAPLQCALICPLAWHLSSLLPPRVCSTWGFSRLSEGRPGHQKACSPFPPTS